MKRMRKILGVLGLVLALSCSTAMAEKFVVGFQDRKSVV